MRIPGSAVPPLLAGLLLASGAAVVYAIVTDLTLVDESHDPQAEHADQDELLDLVQSGQHEEAFEEAFELGDELFETSFNALDGVGANVGDGGRFTRVPRADLDGPGEWASHTPSRGTGPNAQACNDCHRLPFDDGGGPAGGNVVRDAFHTGRLDRFVQRNTPHVFAPGALQVLAEEMTEALHARRAAARARACQVGDSGWRPLEAKGIGFGSIRAVRRRGSPCVVSDITSGVRGVGPDLVVRPFQWKGANATVRDFNRGAAHNELGMQAVEIVGDDVDGDGDGVANEMTVGDMTALAIYLAAQPRPTTLVELADLGLVELDAQQRQAIARGRQVFDGIGCASCHRAQLHIDDPIFDEPSQNPHFRDATFPAGQDPLARGVDPEFPVRFDLTQDQPDNVLRDEDGNVIFRLGSLAVDGQGRAVAELYGDLKRHDLGAQLAEGIDEIGTGAATFLTENLWGVGSTAPYLHDGRATTLTEAILEHGGEASASRTAFRRVTPDDRRALVAFLDNLVLFKFVEEDGAAIVTVAPKGVTLRVPRGARLTVPERRR